MAFRAESNRRTLAPLGLGLELAPVNTVYDALIHSVAAAYSVAANIAERDLFAILKGMVAAESSFNPKAFRAEPQISDASRGLMQVLAGTARALGYLGPLGNDTTRTGGLYTPIISLVLGAKLLAQNLARARAPKHVIALSAYNAGFSSVAGRTDDAKRTAAGVIINQAYVDKILLFAREYINIPFPAPAARPLQDVLVEGV
jgi:soluble lytic murein transglycosylase-like protein